MIYTKAQELNIEQEIWDEFSHLSGYDLDKRMSYGEARAHYEIDYEVAVPRINNINGGQFIYRDADKKIDEALLVGGEINWKEIAKLYPKSEINFKYNFEKTRYNPIYPPAKFRTKAEWRELQEVHLIKWRKQKEMLYDIFPNEDKAFEYLFNKRWEEDVTCPHCGTVEVTQLRKYEGKRFQCNEKRCRSQFSVTVGTIFQNTKVPLSKWYESILLLTSTKTSKLSTPQLAKAIEVTQKSAWVMQQKIKSAINDYFVKDISSELRKDKRLLLI